MESLNYSAAAEVNSAPPAEDQLEVSEEVLEDLNMRLTSVREKIGAIEKASPEMAGNSRFRDVTRNTLAACLSAWKYFFKERGKADYECITSRLPQLEEYLALIERHPDFFAKEKMDQKGAFPDVVDEADELVAKGRNFKIIPYYISEAKKRLEPITDLKQ